MRSQCCKDIPYYLDAIRRLLVSAIKTYLNNRKTDKIIKDCDESIIKIRKDRVDCAIDLVEIYLETTDIIRIVCLLEIAKLISADVGGHGAERIQNIETRLKQKRPLNSKQQEGAKQ